MAKTTAKQTESKPATKPSPGKVAEVKSKVDTEAKDNEADGDTEGEPTIGVTPKAFGEALVARIIADNNKLDAKDHVRCLHLLDQLIAQFA